MKTFFYNDFQVGYSFPAFRHVVSADENDEFVNLFSFSSLKKENGDSLRMSKENVIRSVHPVMIANFHIQHAVFSWPTGVLHAKERMVFNSPVYPGETVETIVHVKDKYLKNGKNFVVLEIYVKKIETNSMALLVERTLVFPDEVE